MTDDSLRDWPRPHFQPAGGHAFLFYLVFGKVDVQAGLSRSKYRTEGPPAFDLMKYSRQEHPQVFESWLSGYLWDRLRVEDPELASSIEACDECIAIRGDVEDPENLNYLRDIVGFLQYCLDNGGIGIHDPQMFDGWSAAEWSERFFESGEALPRRHVTLLESDEDDGTKWYHTRGLRKFGRPDISVKGVPPEYENAVQDLCNRFIEYQSFGGVIEEGREVVLKPLPAGGVAHHRGDLEDPDFNNVHIAIEWPEGLIGAGS